MAKETKINDNITHFNDGEVVVECGPRRITATATEALLHDKQTFKHYQVGLRDAVGNVIELGKEMTFLDWRNKQTAKVHYVYQWQTDIEVTQPDGTVALVDMYVEIDVCDTYEQAFEIASATVEGSA